MSKCAGDWCYENKDCKPVDSANSDPVPVEALNVTDVASGIAPLLTQIFRLKIMLHQMHDKKGTLFGNDVTGKQDFGKDSASGAAKKRRLIDGAGNIGDKGVHVR